MIKKVLTGLYRFIWYTFAIIILNAAVIVTAIRLALPEIGGYKNEIQSWVSEYMNYPVVIDEINAEWQGWAPHLYLNNINLYSQDNSRLISRFDSAHIGIDLLASLSAREVVPTNLSIRGLDLDFTRNLDGSISISSDEDNTLNTNANTNQNALSEWLLKQKHIVIEDTKLRWHNKKAGKEPMEFSGGLIELRTDADRAQFNISVDLPEENGKALHVKMEVDGNILTPDWGGSVYFEMENVNPGRFFSKLPLNVEDGTINAKIWSSWERSKLNEFYFTIDYENFYLNSPGHKQLIQSLIVSTRAQRNNQKDWLLNIDLSELVTLNNVWPASNHQFEMLKDDDDNTLYKFYLSYINLEEIVPHIGAFFHNNKHLAKINLENLSGTLSNTYLQLGNHSESNYQLSVNTDFKDLNLENTKSNIGLTGLDGSLSYKEDKLTIDLDSQSSKIKLADYFDSEFILTGLKSELEYINGTIPSLSIKSFNISNEDISFSSAGNILFNENTPFLDLVAHLDPMDIEKVVNYLPNNTDPDLVEWLNYALVAGEISSADLILRGNLSEFPYKKSEGQFKTILNVTNATLDYYKDWPPIDDLNVEVVFDNDDMFVNSKTGYIFDANIEQITARVFGMSKTGNDFRILVNSNIRGSTNDAKNAILQSPLKENESLLEFANNNVTGNINVDIELDIPFGDEKIAVNGKLEFLDTLIESSLPGLGLEDVNGEINFTRNTVWADGLDAKYFGEPVKLSIPKNLNENDPSRIVLSGKADESFIFSQLGLFFPSLFPADSNIHQFIDGESNWSLTIIEELLPNKQIIKNLELESGLNGIKIALPKPIGKEHHVTHPLKIKTRLVETSFDDIEINYNNEIFSRIFIDNTQDVMVEKVIVGLGKDISDTNDTNKVSISGELNELIVSDWLDLVQGNNTTDSNKKEKSVLFDVKVKDLQLFDHHFYDSQLKLSDSREGWNIIIDGDNVKGNALFTGSNHKKLKIQLDQLNIQEREEQEESNDTKVDIDTIPELDITINDFIYHEKTLGKTNILTSKSEDGINIDKISFSRPGLNISGSGSWAQTGESDKSEINLTLNSETVETMLQSFGHENANIKDGETQITLNANWEDSPLNFGMEKINGVLKIEIDKGEFLDIEPSAGRFFGLLSIQTLPRRLALDFTDLFSEGFAFDSINGTFNLQNGHAYTNDLEMQAPSADIAVNGRTGLITEDYDQIATVTPKITNSLPVASALFGPIGIGVGAVIYLTSELFESIPKNIDNILSLQYSIKGSWDNPDIEEIKENPSG